MTEIGYDTTVDIQAAIRGASELDEKFEVFMLGEMSILDDDGQVCGIVKRVDGSWTYLCLDATPPPAEPGAQLDSRPLRAVELTA